MRTLVRTGAGLAVIAASVAWAVPAKAQARAQAVLTVPATGTFGGGGEFRGTISINRFERRGNEIVAIGFVAGVLRRGSNSFGTAVAGELAWPVRVSSQGVVAGVNGRAPATRVGQLRRVSWSSGASSAAALIPVQAETCPVVNVALGPHTVDLLGVQVALGAVTLDVAGVTGTPLGDAICAASDLLGNVAALVDLLNSILGLVTGLLGGLTGGLSGGMLPVQ